MKTIIIIVSAASLLGLAACGTSKPLATDFGNAVQQNMAVQIIDPDNSTQPPLHDGAHTANAVDRYRKGTVEELEDVTTGSQ